jgi:histidinol-phosphatase (PHP family)
MKSFWTNYHSHSYYCDGVESPQAQLEAAIRQGVKAFGFSSHCPIGFSNTWSMQPERLAEYLHETRKLKVDFENDLEVYVGLEIDYIPEICGPKKFAADLDFTIGSVHYLNKNEVGEPWEIDGTTEKFTRGLVEVHAGDIQKVVKLYYRRIREMIEQDPPDILGHLDKIKIHNLRNSLYDESEDWYQQEIEETLALLAESDCILEANTRGLYKKNLSTYPSMSVLKIAKQRNIPVMINSDSHAPSEITAKISRTALQLRQIGYKTLRVLKQGKWQDIAFNEEGLYL